MKGLKEYRETWYEDSMASREDQFEKLFGPTSPPNQVFKPRDKAWDLTIPGFAFLRHPPTADRPYWLYLTHGLAQPMDFESFKTGYRGGVSGRGMEFALATIEDEAWPFTMLELLTSYSLKGAKTIQPLDRVPASDLMKGPGGHLLAMSDPGYRTEMRTLSGTFDVIHMVGITAAEYQKAKGFPGRIGSHILELALHEFGVGGVTNRNRSSITELANFESVWNECRARVTQQGAGGSEGPFPV